MGWGLTGLFVAAPGSWIMGPTILNTQLVSA